MITELKAPFSPDKVSWRVGSTTADKKKGMALAYIDARDVMERLDEVCGPENWQDRYEVHGGKTICYLSIRTSKPSHSASHGYTPSEWVTKADAAGDTAVEAEKGAVSDAFKRAAVKWGVGRYLYDVPSIWVKLDDYKRIDTSEVAKLQKILSGSRVEAAPVDDTAPIEIKAINFAEAYALTRASADDVAALDEVNKDKIAYAAKYPKAKAKLVEAGVQF